MLLDGSTNAQNGGRKDALENIERQNVRYIKEAGLDSTMIGRP